MSAVRVFQTILPSSVFPWKRAQEIDASDEDRLLKRRKTQTQRRGAGGVSVMRMESRLSETSASSMSDTSEEMMDSDGCGMDGAIQNTESPFHSFTMTIQNRGLPSRLDPFSIDHFAHFECSSDSGRSQAIVSFGSLFSFPQGA